LSSPVPQTLQKAIYGACLGTLVLLGAGCGSSSGPADLSQAGVQEHEASPWLTVKNLRATVYKGTSVESVVRAATATVDQNADVAVLDSVEATVFDQEDWSTRLKSKQGEMFLKDSPERKCSKNDLVLSGGVFMESKQGLTMTVPSVHYFSEKELFISSGGSYELRSPMEGGTWISTGEWFEANKDLTQFTGHRNPRTRSVPAPDRAARPQ
jgi:hypothetical protein